MRTPRSYVRCVLERLGELVDPAETRLDDDVMDEALVRITAMANATMAELALISASFGSGPIVWRSPEPRTADAATAAREVWLGFDGAKDDAIVTMAMYTTKTRIEWFNAEGELLETTEVPGDATAVLYDPERGAHMPLAPEPPVGATRTVSRLIFEQSAANPSPDGGRR